ncbi:esterase B1 [Diabrotica virgifera virgifera]|uniref:Esterase B1-like n=1 Tax=Diabrotica virgifera virgifera TaxID=50390 RepID=A0A6P7FCA2_DIAVI|nr:esterase B1 [Diabrotica virgifera virgifera]XP_028131087.1 esterase B1 [Diabrotica virgifera virgifera]XP_028131088.1 esterase B1 [Diabrotica virgifera virgifera]KAI2473983.1 hypothetical protein C4B38_000075 [Diabrotica virgifera virgifera]
MDSPIVEVTEGQLRGCLRKDHAGQEIFAFLGVPYAQPPINSLRFKAPEPVKHWGGIKDANKEGDPCYSRNFFTGEYLGSEDCLYLNVFTRELPNVSKKLKPVMVWIHGGGYISDSSCVDIFGPDFLITEDIVFVSMNYRLGLLGFLALDDTTLEVPGNAGLKDQNLALQWIKRNIEHFNGDPNNITLFGNSAGASSVHFHILSDKSAGLFHKAILQSGTVFNPWNWGRNDINELLLKAGKVVQSEKEALEILNDMPYKELYKIQEKLHDSICANVYRPVGPVIEKPNKSAFITRSPIEIFRSGNYNKVPMIFGTNKTEGMLVEYNELIFPRFKPPTMSIENAIPWDLQLQEGSAKYNEVKKKLQDYYSAPTRHNDKYLPFSTSLYFLGIVAAVENHVKTSDVPVYFYKFVFEGGLNALKIAKGLSHLPGTCHADEVAYVVKNKFLSTFEPGTPEYTTISRFVKLWTNFARYGNPTPNGDLNIKWETVKKEKFNFLEIGNDLTMENGMDFLELWKDIYQLKPEKSIFV